MCWVMLKGTFNSAAIRLFLDADRADAPLRTVTFAVQLIWTSDYIFAMESDLGSSKHNFNV